MSSQSQKAEMGGYRYGQDRGNRGVYLGVWVLSSGGVGKVLELDCTVSEHIW